MADANTELNFDGMHAAIRDAIALQFADFRTVEFYRDDEDHDFPTPACLLEIEEFEPTLADDAGTGQLPVHARFVARIIMGVRTKDAQREVRKVACALAAYLHQRRWEGIASDAAEVLAVAPDEFDPALDKWAVWRVEWRQLVFLGETAWTNEGAIPESLFSWSPEIGIPHKDDYQPVVPLPPT